MVRVPRRSRAANSHSAWISFWGARHYEAFNSLRRLEDARSLFLLCPERRGKLLDFLPPAMDGWRRSKEFDLFNINISLNPAYLLAATLIETFSTKQWFSDPWEETSVNGLGGDHSLYGHWEQKESGCGVSNLGHSLGELGISLLDVSPGGRIQSTPMRSLYHSSVRVSDAEKRDEMNGCEFAYRSCLNHICHHVKRIQRERCPQESADDTWFFPIKKWLENLLVKPPEHEPWLNGVKSSSGMDSRTERDHATFEVQLGYGFGGSSPEFVLRVFGNHARLRQYCWPDLKKIWVGIIADLSRFRNERGNLSERKLLETDKDNFDDRIKAMHCCLTVNIPDWMNDGQDLRTELVFEEIEDFKPLFLARKIDRLREMLEQRAALVTLFACVDAQLNRAPALATALVSSECASALVSKLVALRTDLRCDPPVIERIAFGDQVLAWTGGIRDEVAEECDHALQTVGAMRNREISRRSGDSREAVKTLIAEIDERISLALEPILHHDAVRELEGFWRGMADFVSFAGTTEEVVMRFMDVSKEELASTDGGFGENENELARDLYQKLVLDERDTTGGRPFNILIADHVFGDSDDDVRILDHLYRIAAELGAILYTSILPEFLGFTSWSAVAAAAPAKLQIKNAHWRQLRANGASQHVVLCAPEVSARPSYKRDRGDFREFQHQEVIEGPDSIVWMRPSFRVASLAIIERLQREGIGKCENSHERKNLLPNRIDAEYQISSGWNSETILALKALGIEVIPFEPLLMQKVKANANSPSKR